MSAAGEGLRKLHLLHIELQKVQDQLELGPRQVQARRHHAAKILAEIGTLKEQYKQLRMSTDQKNLQLKSLESKIADLKGKLNTASSNREYEIINSQVDADQMAKSVLEDEILEALEKVDQAQKKVKAAEQELAVAEAETKRVAGESEATAPGLRSRAAELESALKNAESCIPGTVLEHYRRLVQAHGAESLASIENKACTACHAILSPNSLVELNTGKVLMCRSCGRLLYVSKLE
jgi:predicted  nucleic acid-binding Zn-ribbon protein